MTNTSSLDDLLVVGGGLAGYSAALEALQQGARVSLVEAGPIPGGSSVQSGGSFAFAGTDLQVQASVSDSTDILREDLLSDGGEFVNADLVELYTDRQLDTYDWLLNLSVVFDQVSHSGGQSRPRSHGTKIQKTFALLRAEAKKYPTFTETLEEPALRLLANEGVVTGAVTQGRDGEVARTALATILTTGGFSRSRRAVGTFRPELLHARPMGGPHNNGDGLYMAMALGADLCEVGEVKPTFGVSADTPGMPEEPTLINALYRGAIIVNKDGHRFVDESISYKIIGPICLNQPDGVGFQIFDEKVMAFSIPDKLVNNYSGALERGYILQADTIAKLAQIIGIEPAQLELTIEKYNESVSRGLDEEYGRSSLSSGFGELATIDSPPFYAFPSTAGLTSTFGGLRVDDRMRVLHVAMSPIPGLFAAGEIVGGFHGHGYMSGSSLGKAVIFGRVAAEAALASGQRT